MAAIKERIGIDVFNTMAVERAIAWAAEHGLRYIDCHADLAPNALDSFDEARCAEVRKLCREHSVALGLHTMSSVNTAEDSPLVGEAVDAYLRAYVEAAERLNAQWVVLHAGYHFTVDKDRRRDAALSRLSRICDHARPRGVRLTLENMNWEPDLAEVHYLGHDVEECRFFFDRLPDDVLGWSFTINHATLVPEGIAGFLDALPTKRLREVRIADSNGEYEAHLFPGEGMVDFPDMFRRVEATGYTGPYTTGFGSLDDMLRGRDLLAEWAEGAA